VQQRQGRVQPTTQLQGAAVNDDESLEKEADLMGAQAAQKKAPDAAVFSGLAHGAQSGGSSLLLQRKIIVGVGDDKDEYDPDVTFVGKHLGFNEEQKAVYLRWLTDQQDHEFADVEELKAAVRQASAYPELDDDSQPEPPKKFSYVDHYLSKAPHALDLATSGRRQRMLATSTVTRMILNGFKSASYQFISVDEIHLLHPNDLSDGKTMKRFDIIRNHLRSAGTTDLGKDLIGQLLPSDEEIQVAKTGDARYTSMQGVGRIVAIKEAGKAEGRKLRIEIKMFDLSEVPIVPGQINAISESYQSGEGALSKTVGSLISLGLIAVPLALLVKYFRSS
jgi:hypothetical protein